MTIGELWMLNPWFCLQSLLLIPLGWFVVVKWLIEWFLPEKTCQL